MLFPPFCSVFQSIYFDKTNAKFLRGINSVNESDSCVSVQGCAAKNNCKHIGTCDARTTTNESTTLQWGRGVAQAWKLVALLLDRCGDQSGAITELVRSSSSRSRDSYV